MVVDDEHRAAYHAAACIASNHLVALMGQVERVAASAGLDLDAFVGLARAALTDVAELGPAAALTGPAARGDEATLDRHRQTLDPAEIPGYEAGVALARRLVAERRASPSRGAPDRPSSPVAPARRSRRHGASGTSVPSGPVPAGGVLGVRSSPTPSTPSAPSGRSVGLVPTMGALHAGHRSLIERAAAECDVVAVTVFVNPLQFDDAADLAAYPPRPRHRRGHGPGRRARRWCSLLRWRRCTAPHPAAVASTVHVDGVSEGLEGASRPGHFDGVSTVVAKLFALSGRCRAYFGEKDFQQLAVVRRMMADLSMPVTVVGCATVREVDGFAMSSRNTRLSADERRAATALHRALAGRPCLCRAGRTRPGAGAAPR